MDGILAAVLLWGAVRGWRSGLIRQLASAAGIVAGLLVACMLYAALGDLIAPHLGASLTAARVLAFLLIWVGVPMAFSILAFLLTKTAEGLCLGGLNRLAGAGVGLLKYALLLGCLLHLPSALRLPEPGFTRGSLLAPPLSESGAFLLRQVKASWDSRTSDRKHGPLPETEK